jgi:Tfp pilus assembly PilM family ATPase
MPTMLGFFNEQCLGIEITCRALRIGLLSGNGAAKSVVASRTVPLTAGMVAEAFAAPNIKDSEGLASILRASLKDLAALSVRRASLSLPDGIFRVQTLEFDELPTQHRDRDRLVRWRLEKNAAFDASSTALRYQVFPRRDRGCIVLACVAKQEIIAQYEDLLAGQGLESWAVAPSSFNAVNFYAPYLAGKDIPGFALAWVTEGSYTTIIMEQGVPRFYRHKEIKTGGAPADVTMRLVRELDDSLHFYLHMDRQQQSEVGHLYLAGEPVVVDSLAESLKVETTIAVVTLIPNVVLASATETASSLAAAFGAGGVL